jgi:hypothetical protein
MPCRAPAILLPCCVVALRSRVQSGIVGARQGHGIACVNQARSHCVNQMGKTQSKALTTRHGRGTAGERHSMCEFAFNTVRVDGAVTVGC